MCLLSAMLAAMSTFSACSILSSCPPTRGSSQHAAQTSHNDYLERASVLSFLSEGNKSPRDLPKMIGGPSGVAHDGAMSAGPR
jgi:hypothetical protein